MKPLILLAAVSAALVALHYSTVHVVQCDAHACQLSDGSFRLAPTEKRRYNPASGEFQ